MRDIVLLKAIIGSFAALFVFLSHTVFFNRRAPARRFFWLFRFFLLGLLSYAVFFFCFPSSLIVNLAVILAPLQSAGAFAIGILLLFVLCYLYLYILQVIDRSPSTRMMIEIESSPQRCLSRSQIKAEYSIGEKVVEELEDMVVLGYLVKEHGRYRLSAKGRRHMRIFQWFRDALRLRRS